ncbi:hydantoinase/oxoprolinase family protein [Falsiroseomonas sp. HW251]|uniref:hydantoinase/oxoprolinase family protein n=1 Tax=Falsiroseomonas sp. HW251 TaxID=3390998 RepID=UPI003D319A6B
MTEPTARIAIDVGGTFTDVVLLDEAQGLLRFGKVLSTPEDQSVGSLEGARDTLAEAGIEAGAVRDVVHATTVATNAVLERKGAVTGLVSTEGFRDILANGREARYDIYDLAITLPEPLVPRARRVEVAERLDFRGAVLRPLDDASVIAAAKTLAASGVEAVAICLLHAHVNGTHERRVAEILRTELPQVEISVSSEVAGEAREYERSSTVAVDAYVKPMMRRYVERLADGLRCAGIGRQLSLMLSHGGIGEAREVASRHPVRMIESGPAAGAAAAAYVARQALGGADAVAFDMGGTTAKMSLVRGGTPAVTHEYEVAHVHRFKRGSGLPLQISAVELLEIGAGGGSIARLTQLGLLTVGPHSAGARPGPVCYGRGGTEPTVTDADLLLGYLDPGFFLGGAMTLDVAATHASMTALGAKLGLDAAQAAFGIHDIVNEHMAAAIRAHAAEQGVDLRRFGLIAFGGAGPVHAWALARKLGIPRVVIPFGAGVASAIGCLVAPPAVDMVAALRAPLATLDWASVAARVDATRAGADELIASLAGESATTRLDLDFELRCEGQGYAVGVRLPQGIAVSAGAIAALTAAFAQTYQGVYGHAPPRVPLEVVNLRARVEQVTTPPELRQPPGRGGNPAKGTRPVRFDGRGAPAEATVYDRYALPPDTRFDGPAIVEERETSIVIGSGARFGRDAVGHLVIEMEAGR